MILKNSRIMCPLHRLARRDLLPPVGYKVNAAGEDAFRVRNTQEPNTHLTAAGVPLRKIATNFSTLASSGMNPVLTIPSTITTPITGSTSIFAKVTDVIAIRGSLDNGRGIRRRAKDAPNRIRLKGITISPRNWAGGCHQRMVQSDCRDVRTCIHHKR